MYVYKDLLHELIDEILDETLNTTNRQCFWNLPQSYRSSGELLWDFVSARPDICPERAGSCPPCRWCAASLPLRLCRGGQQTCWCYMCKKNKNNKKH